MASDRDKLREIVTGDVIHYLDDAGAEHRGQVEGFSMMSHGMSGQYVLVRGDGRISLARVTGRYRSTGVDRGAIHWPVAQRDKQAAQVI